ncbi:MAG: WD40 repeat domain-containing protein [Chloroflexi bacterium]|nr:WD40 repeat domain-containing protein [Chloroflexota bacterium]
MTRLKNVFLKGVLLITLVSLGLSHVHAQDDPAEKIVHMQWSHSSQYIALTIDYEHVDIYDVQQGKVVHRFSQVVDRMNLEMSSGLVGWNKDDARLAISGDGYAEIWDLETLTLEQLIHIEFPFGYRPLWSPDDQYLVLIGGGDTTPNMFIWDIGLGQVVAKESMSPAPESEWSHNGEFLAISAPVPHVYLYDIEQLEFDGFVGLSLGEIRQQIDNQDILTVIVKLDWSPDDQYLLTGGSGGNLIVWEVQSSEIIHMKESNSLDPETPLYDQLLRTADVWFSPDGDTFNSIAVDGTYRQWDTVSGELLLERTIELNAPMHYGQTSPDTTKFAYVDYDEGFYIVEIADLVDE